MGSHRHSDRRHFLTESAALAGLAVGALQPAGAQTPQSEARVKDNLAYGQPSRFDNTVRRALGAGTAHHRYRADDTASGSRRDHHAIGPALPDGPRQRHSGYRSAAASPADARHGGPAARVHAGRVEALPVGLARSISSNATPTAARFVVRTAIRCSWCTDEPAAANGPGCCCRSCSRSAA